MAVVESSHNAIQRLIANIDNLCIPSSHLRQELANLIKEYFDHSISESSEYGDISELIVNEIDSESIWEQVQSRSRPLLRSLESDIASLNRKISSARKDAVPQSVKLKEPIDPDVAVSDFAESEENESESESLESTGDRDYSDDEKSAGTIESDMEQFLDEVDQVEERRLAELDNSYSVDKNAPLEYEDDLNLVVNELYELSDESESQDDLRYNDFFKSSSHRSQSKQDSSEEEQEEDEEDGDQDDFDEIDSGIESEDFSSQRNVMTTYGKEKEKLQKHISEMESQLIQPKSWERKGEVMGGDRPENSLLGLAVAVERASKSTPIITPEYSKTIEDMIIERIKASNFSNIVYSKTPVSTASLAPSELSQEKSSVGLGELYAQQFMKDSLHFDQTDEKLKESKEQLLAQFKKVCRQLDGLSHFYFSPKPEVLEFAVKPVAVASISLEEVLPGTRVVSYNSTLAPEQVYEKKRGRDAAFLSINEADRDDRQRLRRAKKAARNQSRKVDTFQNGPRETLDKRIVVSTNTTVKPQKFSKSAAFFSHLQKGVAADIRMPKKEVDISISSSQKLKL